MERKTPNRIINRSRAATVLLRAGMLMVCFVAAINLLCCSQSASAQDASPLPAPLMQQQDDGQGAMPGGDGAPSLAPQRLKRQQPSNGGANSAQLPYNGSTSYQSQPQTAPMPYTGVEQWNGNHLGPSNTMQQYGGGYPAIQAGTPQRRHRKRNGPFGLVNNMMMNQGMRPRRNQPEQDPTAADASIRPPDQFADNPNVDADGVRHFANGQHFDLNKVSIDQAIGAVRMSDPNFARMNRMNNPNAFGSPANNGLFPMNFGAFR